MLILGIVLILVAVVLFVLSIVLAIMAFSRRSKAKAAPVSASSGVANVQAGSMSSSPQAVPSDPAPLDATVAVPVGFGSLYCTAGKLAGQRFTIAPAGLWIGRDAATAQIVVPESAVSKRHVWIGPRDGGIVAIDEGSTNGTFLNSPTTPRITHSPLRPGDRLILVNESVAAFEYHG